MKLVIEKKTGIVKYAVEDNQSIIIQTNRIFMPGAGHNGCDRYVCDLNSNNSEVIENVTVMPDGFDKTKDGNKFTYDKQTEQFTAMEA